MRKRCGQSTISSPHMFQVKIEIGKLQKELFHERVGVRTLERLCICALGAVFGSTHIHVQPPFDFKLIMIPQTTWPPKHPPLHHSHLLLSSSVHLNPPSPPTPTQYSPNSPHLLNSPPYHSPPTTPSSPSPPTSSPQPPPSPPSSLIPQANSPRPPPRL